MHLLRNFLIDIKSSFFGPAFYAEGRSKSLGSAVGFLFFSALLTSFLLVIVFAIIIIPSILSAKPAQLVEEKFPSDLSVVIKDGKASANVEQPYLVPIPEEQKVGDKMFENYFVIDTRPDITIAMLEEYNSAVVLTEKSLYVSEEKGKGRVVPLTDAEDVVIDKTYTTDLVKGLMAVFWVIVPLMLIFAAPFIAAFGVLYFLVMSLVGAVIPLAIAKLRKIPMTYGEAYKTALYGTVPIMFITTIWLFFGLGGFPMFLDVLLFAFLLSLNLKSQKESALPAD